MYFRTYVLRFSDPAHSKQTASHNQYQVEITLTSGHAKMSFIEVIISQFQSFPLLVIFIATPQRGYIYIHDTM